ncbi:MAG: FAD-binding protein [Ignavibacteria bacterium]
MNINSKDIIIIGSGLVGLSAALRLASKKRVKM